MAISESVIYTTFNELTAPDKNLLNEIIHFLNTIIK